MKAAPLDKLEIGGYIFRISYYATGRVIFAGR
jgi:hypothetical protein